MSATGNALLDDHIKKQFVTSVKVNYLEELRELKTKHNDADVVILSSFLPTTHDDTEEEAYISFENTINSLLYDKVRVVFLTDTSTPIETLRLLFSFGIYDFIVSQDGDVSLEEIIKKTNTPTSKSEAEKQLERLVSVMPSLTQVEKQKTKHASEQEEVLYHELDTKEVYEQEPSSFVEEQEVYHHAEYQDKEVESHEKESEMLEEEVVNNLNNATDKATRKKATAKTSTSIEEPKVFSFWSPSTNLGKRTVSQAFASQIAKLGYGVLYVEFDYMNPSLAITTALSSKEKNFYQLSLSQDSFDLRQYIANKMDVRITKEMVSLFEGIPQDLHFLGLPSGFDSEQFPSITNEEFLSTLLSALRDVEYDAVVINLPSQVDNLFGFPVMLESDVIFSVTTANPVRIKEYRNMMKMLVETPLKMDKWEVIVNQVGEGITKETCDQLLREEESIIAIPYDNQRPADELDLKMGSPIINKKMEELAGMYGFMAPEPQVAKKKGLFGLKLK
ncbi:hypothetical protein RZN22_18380 [Bacillaceae bacterium S4-13-58]